MFQLSGKVKEIFEEQTFASGFNKREFVVTTAEDRYPQDISFECLKEKVSLVEELSKGEDITVFFDIRGREWNGKYFVNLSAWKIEKGTADDSDPGARENHSEPSSSAPRTRTKPAPSGEIDDEEVPF